MNIPTILKKIELRIIELGMTKTEFYEKSGISSATYSQWNTKTFRPSKRKLMDAASALKMTYEELVGEESTSEQKEIPPTEKVDGIRTLCKTGYTHCGSRTNQVSCEMLCEICSQILPNHLANRYSMIAFCRLVGLSSNIISPLEFPAIMPTSRTHCTAKSVSDIAASSFSGSFQVIPR